MPWQFSAFYWIGEGRRYQTTAGEFGLAVHSCSGLRKLGGEVHWERTGREAGWRRREEALGWEGGG